MLRAIRTLHVERSHFSLPTLLAIVPLEPLRVAATLRALDGEGYIALTRRAGADGVDGIRLTMRGFVASHAPSVVAFERRRGTRSPERRGASTRETARVA